MKPCNLWTGAQDGHGYGAATVSKHGTRMVHRIAWIDANGPIPEGMCVLHRCDTPLCREPEHLFLGTRGDNARDAKAKRRHSHGDKHGSAKLTNAQAIEIMGSNESEKALVARYGVCRRTISRVRNGHSQFGGV